MERPVGILYDDERVRALAVRRIERVPLRVESCVRDAAALELGEERLEPERMLVEDPDGPLHVQAANDRRGGLFPQAHPGERRAPDLGLARARVVRWRDEGRCML